METLYNPALGYAACALVVIGFVAGVTILTVQLRRLFRDR